MAPRLAWRALKSASRGAWQAVCLGLAGIAAADEVIISAQFQGETDAYQHCILGDCIEYSALEIVSRSGDGTLYSRTTQLWPQPFVFEDIAPRLWDVTGDGFPEVVVILTSFDQGASLAVFGLDGRIAQTPFIGRSNRWLAPVGTADFDGDGQVEVAFVDRPHLAKTLRIFEWDGSALVLDAEVSGLTNHRIGEDFITGGVRDCGDGAQMVTANADWSSVMVTSFDGSWRTREVAPFSAQAVDDALDCAG